LLFESNAERKKEMTKIFSFFKEKNEARDAEGRLEVLAHWRVNKKVKFHEDTTLSKRGVKRNDLKIKHYFALEKDPAEKSAQISVIARPETCREERKEERKKGCIPPGN